jgi:hypothetical protein
LTPEKGAEAAIRLARREHIPLRIAAKVPRDASRYVKEKIEPQRDEQKQEFLAKALWKARERAILLSRATPPAGTRPPLSVIPHDSGSLSLQRTRVSPDNTSSTFAASEFAERRLNRLRPVPANDQTDTRR